MKEKLFREMCESIEEMGAYLRGETRERLRIVDYPDRRVISILEGTSARSDEAGPGLEPRREDGRPDA